jgi:hypothetical protein
MPLSSAIPRVCGLDRHIDRVLRIGSLRMLEPDGFAIGVQLLKLMRASQPPK